MRAEQRRLYSLGNNDASGWEPVGEEAIHARDAPVHAKAKAPFVVNGSPRVAYLTSILWQWAGRPGKDN